MGRSDSGSQPWFACENDLQIPSLRESAHHTKAGQGCMATRSFRTMRKAASTRVFWEADLQVAEELVRGRRQVKRPALSDQRKCC